MGLLESHYIRKMTHNGSYNLHKMVKNAPNELKFGPDMYFNEFYQIPEDFWKILKICQFSAEKRSFSACFASFF